jgi:rhomboid protease GluP
VAGPAAGFSFTKALLALLAVIYAAEVAAAGPATLMLGPSTLDLIRLGAGIGAAWIPGEGAVGIALDQQWRLLTAMFLHAGLLHLAMNGYVLYVFGSIVEQELGRVRFLAAYLVTGLCSSVASYAFGPYNAAGVGASGAIFGLVGAYIAYNWHRRDIALHAARVSSALTFVLINAVISFTVPSIDWRAHFGGLAAGVVAGIAARGRGGSTKAAFIAGLAGLLGLAAILTAWRTAELRQILGA